MSVLKGSMDYRRFLGTGEVPDMRNPATLKALQARAFLPLHPDGESIESAGWVSPTDPHGPQDTANGDTLFMDPSATLVVLTYREDKYAIPRPVLQAAVRERIAKIVKEEDKAEKELSRAFIKVVEKAVLAELRHKFLPKRKVIEAVWATDKAELRVFGGGGMERVPSLLERTFGVRVEPATYAARAYAGAINEDECKRLDKLFPGLVAMFLPGGTTHHAGASDDG